MNKKEFGAGLLALMSATTGARDMTDVLGKPLPLTGLEIANVRTSAPRSTLPTKRRYLMWKRKQERGTHIGDKQAAKIAARAAAKVE